jgi:hypothetical protein
VQWRAPYSHTGWTKLHTDTIIDPFCGYGSVLAIANEAGLHSVGVDKSRTRCRRAERLSAVGFRTVRTPSARGRHGRPSAQALNAASGLAVANITLAANTGTHTESGADDDTDTDAHDQASVA